MNTEVKLTKSELQDIWSALAYFISNYPDKGSEITKNEMRKIIKKIRGGK